MHNPVADTEAVLFSERQQSLKIAGPAGVLELRLKAGVAADSQRVAIICHPHPLHGGTMDNKVVTTLARTYGELGMHCLRFNFRGVGNSEGSHGYLQGEIEDLRAVVNYVRQRRPDLDICLAGFSFGAAVAANVARADEAILHLLMIAPPVGKYDLEFPSEFLCPTLVVQGTMDDIVDLQRTRDWAAGIGGNFIYVEMDQAGHFFHGKLTELRDRVVEHFNIDQPMKATS
jgi:uncharacterized protein